MTPTCTSLACVPRNSPLGPSSATASEMMERALVLLASEAEAESEEEEERAFLLTMLSSVSPGCEAREESTAAAKAAVREMVKRSASRPLKSK